MTDSSDKAILFKCRACEKTSHQPVVCDYCHALKPSAGVTDFFTLLDMPRQFDLDEHELHRRFVSLSRHAHPDFHVRESGEVQTLSLQISSTLNDAYRTLRDPFTRAGYLLNMLGGKSSAQDKSVPDGFLGTMMMLQEELDEARSRKDQTEVDRVRQVLHVQHEGLMRRVVSLLRDCQDAAPCEAVRQDLLGEVRRQLNAVSYVKKLLSQAT